MLKCMNLALGYEEDSEGKLNQCWFCAGFRFCSRILLLLDASSRLSVLLSFRPSVCSSVRGAQHGPHL